VKLNRVEKALMNNPVRASLQRHYETPLLEQLGGRLDGQRVLEVGCGRGVGTDIIVQRFGAADVHAFDLDPDMVRQARQRLADYPPGRVTLYQADVTAIPEPDASFDAVVDFGIIHHVPAWREAVAEIHRVLKPAGRFYFEEVTRQALGRWFYRTFLDHPSEDRFSAEEFLAALEAQGIVVGERYQTRFFGDFVLGVGRKLR
jgi:ubiquinone/menaquinone biosynthesis C-methylase UbiE